jgi:hypothetical protein
MHSSTCFSTVPDFFQIDKCILTMQTDKPGGERLFKQLGHAFMATSCAHLCPHNRLLLSRGTPGKAPATT